MKRSKLLTIPRAATRMLPAPTHLRRLFVALVVLLTMTAQTAWADITGDGSAENPYTINTATDWETFAQRVTNGETFEGKYVQLGDNFENSTSPITKTAGYINKDFKGIFDGRGKTMYVNLSASSTSDGKHVALFGSINGATIQNVRVEGDITSNNLNLGTFAGRVEGNSTIRKCWSNAAIVSTKVETNCGGMVGYIKAGTLTIIDCAFTGSIVLKNSGYDGGGFAGWTDKSAPSPQINNCIFSPSVLIATQKDNKGYVFVTGDVRATLNNCYYNSVAKESELNKEGNDASGMTNEALLAALGSGWEVIGNNVVPIISANHLYTATITGVNSRYSYNGSAHSITPVVTDAQGNTLTLGTDYTATLGSANVTSFPFTVTDKGDYTLTVTGIGSYRGTQSISFSVSDCPDGLFIDNEISEGTVGHYYVNMPKTDMNTLTLTDATITTFKVYDDGGKSGNYSNKCNGTLTLTAPTGYVLQLSGSITTEKGYDKLTVYDGSEASGTKLLDAVSSTGSSGTQTAIQTAYSTGQSMTLCFNSDNSNNYAGLDLTVTVVSTSTESDITVNNPATGGSVAASVGGTTVTTAKWNDAVTLTATPESGYLLCDLSVKDASNNAVALEWNTWANTATFTMPATAVTVTPTFTNDLTSLSVNMPKTGTKRVTIPTGVQSFKVYDDGGSGGNYSNNCKGTLTLTAPEGYVLQLSGNITTEKTYDKLTVYDGSGTSGTKLLDEVSSTSNGTQTAIETVVSTGQSMTLYFYSNGSTNYAGLDLTVTVVSTSAKSDITVNTASGGSVAADKSEAKVNETVTLTATPENGYLLTGISVKDASDNAVALEWNVWTNTATFSMPATAVTVTPTFTNDLTSLSVNMPKTGTKLATIPTGVQSFKVYDDGGEGGTGYSAVNVAGGNYSNSCSGYLVLTAPEGYVLLLSGNIKTEIYDKLTVYDGSGTSATKLLDAVSSTSNGTATAIETVVSTGRSMTLYFYSNNSDNYAGLDLTVTVVSTSAEYDITVNTATGGSVAADKSKAKVNETVTLTATPESGYLLTGISVKDASNNAVAVTWDGSFSNTATFTMPATAVTVTPTFTNTLTADDGLYINMPATGSKSVTIPTGVQSFKVYDDGGEGGTGYSAVNVAGGNYSNSCDGYLTLTAPEGYVLLLSGNITTENTRDRLTVYDNSAASVTRLLDEVSSSSSGTATAIQTVTSTGQSMMLYFYSDSGNNYAGLDLTVTVVSTSTEYDITVNTATGGSVAASISGTTVTKAKVNETVTLTATPESGYLLSDLSVKDASDNAVAVTWDGSFSNTATFRMPASAVTVTPTFTNTWTAVGGLYINMPTTGKKKVTIPTGVQSFKVYDDGGSGGNYSDNCVGYLVLTAPTGYVLQLSGNIMTEITNDKLTVYDNSAASGTPLLDAVSSTSDGTKTAITTVHSSGQSMTLCFNSDNSKNYAGLDLTVTLVPITYTITYDLAGGTVATDNPATYTILSDAITLNNPTKDGYTFAGWFDNAEFTGSAVTTITAGSTGNKTFWAKWIQDLTYGGVTIKDNGTTKSATLDASQESTISITSDVVVNAVELNRDFTANQPATVMLPFSLGTGQTVNGGSFYKFSGVTKDGDEWKAQFTQVATLKANTPYLFMPSATGQMTFNLNGGTVTLNTTTTGDAGSTASNWEFRGTYQKVQWDGTASDPSDLSKTYGFAKGNGTTIAAGQFVHFAAGAWLKPMRCYLVYNGSTEGGTFQNAPSRTRGAASTEELPQTITVVLLSSSGETTGIGTLDTKTGDITLDGWYTMDGRKLEGKPTKKGLYINNGHKIVIK